MNLWRCRLKAPRAYADSLGDARTAYQHAMTVSDATKRKLEFQRAETLFAAAVHAAPDKPELLAERGGAFYSEAAAQLIASLHAGTGDVQVVDIRNDGTLAGLSDDDVVEVPADLTSGVIHYAGTITSASGEIWVLNPVSVPFSIPAG